ncbi:MAG: hypothetical protein HY234_05510 [Acidobacteria bacterium]|nr:hypothetical protein [Acidobacteriota bacterium]MBI3662492.1 hypothetical protein [Acidobacteriota bacterium]
MDVESQSSFTAQEVSIRRHAWAWVALTLALAVHVVDEALMDFLSFYNPTVLSLRARYSWFPMPTFTFDVWLTGLIGAVIVLLLLSVFAFRGSRAMVYLSYPYGILMLFNGLGHSVGSVYFGRLLPGVYSSPLLLAASVWLFVCAARRRKKMAT